MSLVMLRRSSKPFLLLLLLGGPVLSQYIDYNYNVNRDYHNYQIDQPSRPYYGRTEVAPAWVPQPQVYQPQRSADYDQGFFANSGGVSSSGQPYKDPRTPAQSGRYQPEPIAQSSQPQVFLQPRPQPLQQAPQPQPFFPLVSQEPQPLPRPYQPPLQTFPGFEAQQPISFIPKEHGQSWPSHSYTSPFSLHSYPSPTNIIPTPQEQFVFINAHESTHQGFQPPPPAAPPPFPASPYTLSDPNPHFQQAFASAPLAENQILQYREARDHLRLTSEKSKKHPPIPPADRFVPYASDILSGQLEREAREGRRHPHPTRSIIVSDSLDDFSVTAPASAIFKENDAGRNKSEFKPTVSPGVIASIKAQRRKLRHKKKKEKLNRVFEHTSTNSVHSVSAPSSASPSTVLLSSSAAGHPHPRTLPNPRPHSFQSVPSAFSSFHSKRRSSIGSLFQVPESAFEPRGPQLPRTHPPISPFTPQVIVPARHFETAASHNPRPAAKIHPKSHPTKKPVSQLQSLTSHEGLKAAPNSVFLACCKARNVPDVCEPRCNFDIMNKKLLTGMFLGTDPCPQKYGRDLLACAAQDSDHSACCIERGVNLTAAKDKCLGFCKMTPGTTFQADLSMIPCWGVLNEIKTCFKEFIKET